MKSEKVQYMSIMAMFLTIQIILVVTLLGYLPIGPISVTTMYMPVIIAGITLGKKAGTRLGFVFGLTSVLNATFRPTLTSFCFSPFVAIGGIGGNWMSLLVAFVPRILLGYLAGLIYGKLCRKRVNESAGVIAGALTRAVTNTVLVPGGIYPFFGNACADAIKVAHGTLIAVLLGVVATNEIAGTILRTVTTLLVCRAVRPITRKLS